MSGRRVRCEFESHGFRLKTMKVKKMTEDKEQILQEIYSNINDTRNLVEKLITLPQNNHTKVLVSRAISDAYAVYYELQRVAAIHIRRTWTQLTKTNGINLDNDCLSYIRQDIHPNALDVRYTLEVYPSINSESENIIIDLGYDALQAQKILSLVNCDNLKEFSHE